ncbi:MAG: DUF2958 domain-containing protein [Psychrobacter sp.]|nr:DUF2958 domain-containing protein [Psychrobacter sp.]
MQNLPQDFFGAHLIAAYEQSPEQMEKALKIAKMIETMPKTYEQDGKGNEAIAYLHYQIRHPNYQKSDWYITEKDLSDDQLQAFGLVSLSGGRPELGYINLVELGTIELVTLDLDFTPTRLGEIRTALANRN